MHSLRHKRSLPVLPRMQRLQGAVVDSIGRKARRVVAQHAAQHARSCRGRHIDTNQHRDAAVAVPAARGVSKGQRIQQGRTSVHSMPNLVCSGRLRLLRTNIDARRAR